MINSLTGSGVVDLARLAPSDIDWAEIAAGLARLPRFNGGPAGSRPIFVAQHCATGADVLFAETGDPALAGFFVLHDAHEKWFGDLTTPAELLLARHGAPGIRAAVASAKAALDSAIFAAAGLPVPGAWPRAAREAVHTMDRRMARAEALALFGPAAAKAMPPAKPLSFPIVPWPEMRAEEIWLERLNRYLGIKAR